MTVRTHIQVERPPISDQLAETWRVTVTQVKCAWGWSFEVLGTLVAEHVPRRYDLDKAEWVEPFDRVIPGVQVPVQPETFTTLGKARSRARELASHLEGRVHPQWVEKNS